MSDFGRTNWAKTEFTQNYRNGADIFIVERRRMLDILRSCYRHFVQDGSPKRLLDLGCGDGIVTASIVDVEPSVTATLVDGSEDMLARAGERLKDLKNARYLRASFQEMLGNDPLEGQFDVVLSALAIHHLTMGEKTALFRLIHKRLERGGRFVNIDVVRGPSEELEQWYLALWREWMAERKRNLGIIDDRCDDIVERYKDLDENKPDRLSDQLDALRAIGFRDVDCYYKYGIFAVFGGRT
jgi:tRNA (cmo5U34)-methyltransferase